MKERLNSKIYIIKIKRILNSASGNRYSGMQKMLQKSFDVEILEKNYYPQKNKLKKILGGIIVRVQVGLLALKVPKSTNDTKHVVVLFSINALTALIVSFIGLFKGYKLIIERNEYPAPIRNKNKLKKLFYKLFILPWQYRLYDGLFLMTDELIQFYKRYTRKNCVIQKLPMTVDFDRFISADEKTVEERYIAYTGSLANDKDGILYLLEAFKSISGEFKDIKLKIAGGKKEEIAQHKKYIESFELSNRIDFLGFLSSEKIPDLIQNAMMLVLPRPDSLQARGGFPTKLGEYLATAKPVIVTRVGEIPNLLNKDEVFFIDPDNIAIELADKITFILNNYSSALRVGEKGREKAFNTFSLKANTQKVANLINEVVNI